MPSGGGATPPSGELAEMRQLILQLQGKIERLEGAHGQWEEQMMVKT